MIRTIGTTKKFHFPSTPHLRSISGKSWETVEPLVTISGHLKSIFGTEMFSTQELKIDNLLQYFQTETRPKQFETNNPRSICYGAQEFDI